MHLRRSLDEPPLCAKRALMGALESESAYTLRAASAMQSSAAWDVLSDADLVALILAHAQDSPASLAAHSRVCHVWRAVCRTDERLLKSAALARPMTKRAFMALFALSSPEADILPRGMRARVPSGFMYMYTAPAVREVLPMLGGMPGWRRRVERRGAQGLCG